VARGKRRTGQTLAAPLQSVSGRDLSKTLGFEQASREARRRKLKRIRRRRVDSTYLRSVGYDAADMVLEAEFNDDSIYRYYGVPQDAVDGLFAAESVGTYFLHEIRDRYPHEAMRLAEYRQTPEYVNFVRTKLNVVYIEDDASLRQAIDEICSLETSVAVDFECAIDSYAEQTKGALRLVQLGVDDPERGIEPKQWLIDCFRVDSTPVLEVFSSEQEKQIHFSPFELGWATERFGEPISNIYDTCLASRGVQAYLTNMLRAADYALLGKNIPRSVRRALGCTLSASDLLRARLEPVPDGDARARAAADPVAAGPDEELRASSLVNELENEKVLQAVLPAMREKLEIAGYTCTPIDEQEARRLLGRALGYAPSKTPKLSTLLALAAATRCSDPTAPADAQDEPAGDDDAERALRAQAAREKRKRQLSELPYVFAERSGETAQLYLVEGFDCSKRANTSFHPNTLAFLAKRFLGFELPKTEQAGYWGRPELSASQRVYAAVDVACLPTIASEMKRIVAALGIEKQVYEQRIGALEERTVKRVAERLERGEYRDQLPLAEMTLDRAQTLPALEAAWSSLRQMALVAPSYQKLLRRYERRRRELEGGRRARRSLGDGDVPF
jgi:ribonuclease D